MKHTILFLAAMLLTTTMMAQKIQITIGGQTQNVTLADNAATKVLVEKLRQAPVNVTLNSSGGFEIWGPLGFSLPTSNEQINAQPGDIVLYNGSNICMFYGSNSWGYTRLGKIDGLSGNELRTFLKAGESNITVMLSLTNTTGIKSPSSTSSAKDDGACYMLNGAKVKNPSKGVCINNGKKVIF